MKRLLILIVTLYAGAVCAQAQETRTTLLDRAYDEVRAADTALKAAEAKRNQSEEPQPGERTGTVSGFTRLNENYFARQQALELEIAAARKRYDDAVKRWNELK
jgi:hypothetical protein